MVRVALTIAAAVAACGDATSPPPASVAGCYELRTSRVATNSTTMGFGFQPSLGLPTRIVLLDSIGTGTWDQGDRLARPFPLGTPMHYEFGIWRQPSSATLDVVFGYAEGGTAMHYAWMGREWRGTAEPYTDIVMPIPTRSSTLRPISCS